MKGNGLVLTKQKKLYKIPQYYGRILMNPNSVTDQEEKIVWFLAVNSGPHP